MDQLKRISEEEQARHKKAVEYARRSVRLEGFTLDADIESRNQPYVNGELTSDELTAATKRAVADADRSRLRTPRRRTHPRPPSRVGGEADHGCF